MAKTLRKQPTLQAKTVSEILEEMRAEKRQSRQQLLSASLTGINTAKTLSSYSGKPLKRLSSSMYVPEKQELDKAVTGTGKKLGYTSEMLFKMSAEDAGSVIDSGLLKDGTVETAAENVAEKITDGLKKLPSEIGNYLAFGTFGKQETAEVPAEDDAFFGEDEYDFNDNIPSVETMRKNSIAGIMEEKEKIIDYGRMAESVLGKFVDASDFGLEFGN